MAKKSFYSEETKWEVIKLKEKGISNSVIMEQLSIKNVSQIKTWMKWYREGQTHRFSQPIGKQYSYGKGPEGLSEMEGLKRKNMQLEVEVEILKKYQEIQRRWSQK
jgi:transposase